MDELLSSLDDPSDLLGGIRLIVALVHFQGWVEVAFRRVAFPDNHTVARPGYSGPQDALCVLKEESFDYDKLWLIAHPDPCPPKRRPS